MDTLLVRHSLRGTLVSSTESTVGIIFKTELHTVSTRYFVQTDAIWMVSEPIAQGSITQDRVRQEVHTDAKLHDNNLLKSPPVQVI